MKLLVFQHCAGETPAAFGAHAQAAGDSLYIVHLYNSDVIPPLGGFDALLVMGGPMDVWETTDHPWLGGEIAAIAEWVSLGKPYLGICLGHQLLAAAIGGTCTKMARPEIAVSDVTLGNVKDDPLFAALPNQFPAMHWHGVEVTDLPPNAKVLGWSSLCANQVMRVNNRAWGVQFHPELEPGTLRGWMQDAANLNAAVSWLGSEADAWDFVDASETRADEFLRLSAAIYTGFRSVW